jgi:probable HAF family extracellular repeat protein
MERVSLYVTYGFAAFSLAAAAALPGVVWAASFTGVGDLPGGIFQSSANGVSADGSTVVGASTSTNGTEAFEWTSGLGMVGLGDLPGMFFRSTASAASDDGSVVVGSGTSTVNEPVIWNLGVPTGLGDHGGAFSLSAFATGVSADGAAVVGQGISFGLQATAWRWTLAEGIVPLGYLVGGGAFASANGISQDGSVIVGQSDSSNGSNEAFRWTSQDGTVGLGDLAGGEFLSLAKAASADGSFIVGQGTPATGRQAFRWTLKNDMVGLGVLPGGNTSIAYGVSADGSVVVGESNGAAFVWDSENGMRSLLDVLEVGFGLDLTGWTLEEARAVSDDGLGNPDSISIVGYGENPGGKLEGFLARIPLPVPEPGTDLLRGFALATLVGIGRLRARRSR